MTDNIAFLQNRSIKEFQIKCNLKTYYSPSNYVFIAYHCIYFNLDQSSRRFRIDVNKRIEGMGWFGTRHSCHGCGCRRNLQSLRWNRSNRIYSQLSLRKPDRSVRNTISKGAILKTLHTRKENRLLLAK